MSWVALIIIVVVCFVSIFVLRARSSETRQELLNRNDMSDRSFVESFEMENEYALPIRNAVAEALNVNPNLLRPTDSFSRDLNSLTGFDNLDGTVLLPIIERKLGFEFSVDMCNKIPDPYTASPTFTLGDLIRDVKRLRVAKIQSGQSSFGGSKGDGGSLNELD